MENRDVSSTPTMNPISEQSTGVSTSEQIEAIIYPSSVNEVSQLGVSGQETLSTHESSRGLNNEDETASDNHPHFDDSDPYSNSDSDSDSEYDSMSDYDSEYETELRYSPDGEDDDGNWHYSDDDDNADDVGYNYDDNDDDDDSWIGEVDEDDLDVDEYGVPFYPYSRK